MKCLRGIVIIWLVAAATGLRAEEIAVILPSDLGDFEGEGVGLTSFPAGRLQGLYAGELFSSVPETHRLITGFRWRPDASVQGPMSHLWPNLEVRLSTVGRSRLSMTFDDNLGTDETVVYEGPFELSTDAVGPPRGPYDFDIEVRFQTPFVFDPTQGNLLTDLIWTEPIRFIPVDTCCNRLDSGVEWISRTDGNPLASRATHQGFGGGTQFLFAPGPFPGDFDLNGVLDAADIDALQQAIFAGTHPEPYDLNADSAVDQGDLEIWVRELKGTYFGDANLDGEFNSVDLVELFTAGQYEDAVENNSKWWTGDWNTDQDFDSADMVLAFQDGGYERGPQIAAVPEPPGMVLACAFLLGVVDRFRRRVFLAVRHTNGSARSA